MSKYQKVRKHLEFDPLCIVPMLRAIHDDDSGTYTVKDTETGKEKTVEVGSGETLGEAIEKGGDKFVD